MGIDYQYIISNFRIEGEIDSVTPYGNGLINKTYLLQNRYPNVPDYLLQRINHNVFDDIKGLISNLEMVTSHLKNKSHHQDSLLIPIATITESLVYVYQGQYWRVFLFLKELKSYDKAINLNYVYEGAKAFGKFVSDMRDFPTHKLNIVIPNFHHLGTRFEELKKARTNAESTRVTESAELHEEGVVLFQMLQEMMASIDQNAFPIRVIHNDTKFNNVLFNSNGEASCVIDLDTVMPGIIHYDFGDGLRTGAVECSEDERDLNKVFIKEEKLEAFCRGYLEPLGNILTPTEIRFLPLAPTYMTFIMAVRFLTDFLNGDSYYLVKYHNQNLIRARCQMKLSKLFYEKRGALDDLITKQLNNTD